MQPVLTTTEMQAVDALAMATTPLDELVERAGTKVALAALELMGGAYGRRVVLICGRGNNGADGRVAARLLARRGARVRIVAPGEVDDLIGAGPGIDLVVDAAFGTGFRGTYDAPRVPAGVPVLAVDIPSGVAGDTGEACGRPLAATRTVTFVAPKPGLLQWDGAALAGEVTVVDIGLPVGAHRIDLLEDADVAGLLPGRDPGGNKWRAAVGVVRGWAERTVRPTMCANCWRGPGSRWWSTPTGCTRSDGWTSSRCPRVRRWCSLHTTASTSGCWAPPPAPTGSRRPACWLGCPVPWPC